MSNKLEYGRRRPARRLRRLWVALILFAVAASGALKYRRRIEAEVRYQYYQRQCLHYSKPADFVVYESDPQRAAGLLASNPEFSRDSLGVVSHNAKPLIAIWPYASGMIFIHERISPAGHRRLVFVAAPPEHWLSFRRYVEIPKKWFETQIVQRSSESLADWINTDRLFMHSVLDDDRVAAWQHEDLPDLKRDRDGRLKVPLRLYFGQPDPNNDSHFTIRYEVGSEPGIIDGWLGDDDAVRMQAHGPWAIPLGKLIVNGKDIMVP